MKPTDSRQCVYMDLLPFPKGLFKYILFAVDAYSQYIMTVPLINNDGNSVKNGITSIFSATSVYNHVFADNKTFFATALETQVSSFNNLFQFSFFSPPSPHTRLGCGRAILPHFRTNYIMYNDKKQSYIRLGKCRILIFNCKCKCAEKQYIELLYCFLQSE